MNTHTAIVLRRTYQIVKSTGITQMDHCEYIWRDYVNRKEDAIDISDSTISRRMRGMTLPDLSFLSESRKASLDSQIQDAQSRKTP